MSEVASSASKTFSALNNADLEFPKIIGEDGEEVQITHGNYITMLESDNREVRESAFSLEFEYAFCSSTTSEYIPICVERTM